jgi:hypothetical protein
MTMTYKIGWSYNGSDSLKMTIKTSPPKTNSDEIVNIQMDME